jgi:transcriptional regulator with XRE-family HTH domain
MPFNYQCLLSGYIPEIFEHCPECGEPFMKRQNKSSDGEKHTVGAYLRQIREEKGLTLRKLAEELSYGKSTIGDVENGRIGANSELINSYEEKFGYPKGVLYEEIDAIRRNSPDVVIELLMENALLWLAMLDETIFYDRQKAIGVGRVTLNELQQQRCLKLALKNAAEQTLMSLETSEQRKQCCRLLFILSSAGDNGLACRQTAILYFFTPVNFANNKELMEISERLSRKYAVSPSPLLLSPSEQQMLHTFIGALVWHLSLDPWFKQQMGDAIIDNLPAFRRNTPRDIVSMLHLLYENYENAENSVKEFPQEIQRYAHHIEHELRFLRVAGVVSREQKVSLDAVFIAPFLKRAESKDMSLESIVPLLQKDPYLALLGRPGAGKSTQLQSIAWRHAAAYLEQTVNEEQQPLLLGCPLPLYIELQHFVKHYKKLVSGKNNSYSYDDFLFYAASDGLKSQDEERTIQISPQMFKELLERRCMVVQFDGLDEVFPLEQRQQIVQAIEQFTLHYPGNFIIVTSRPLGYELAPCSPHLFVKAQLQEFDDERIKLFVRQWYIYAAQSVPLSNKDEEEIELLLKLLKSSGLHRLAVNPLLLTVVTSQYSHGHLPEKRVEVYEDCAQLLLFKWTSIKGTRNWWEDLKMEQNDLYACIAHLGLILHGQLQAQNPRQSGGDEDIAEVEEVFILEKMTRFIRDQSMIVGATEEECAVKAHNFFELIKAEVGLIVESGTLQGDKYLYSFIHRTFQEYFAAGMIYFKYQQEVDPEIISSFLREHLHEPHWHEVLLLLLEKLPRKLANAQLERVLDANFYSSNPLQQELFSIVQQNLFFVVMCMLDDIPLENTLAESVVSRLNTLLENPPFEEQRGEAQRSLISLMQSQRYAPLVYQTLLVYIERDDVSLQDRLYVATIIYQNASMVSYDVSEVFTILLEYVQRSDTLFTDAVHFARILYHGSLNRAEKREQAFAIFLQLAQHPEVLEPVAMFNLTVVNIARVDVQGQQHALQILLSIINRVDIAIEQQVQLIENFCISGSRELAVWQIGFQVLTFLEQKQVQIDYVAQIAYMLYSYIIPMLNVEPLDEQLRVQRKLLNLLQHADMNNDLKLQIAGDFLNNDNVKLQQVAMQTLQDMAQRRKHIKPSSELLVNIVNVLYKYGTLRTEQKDVLTLLLEFASRRDVPVESMIAVALHLYHVGSFSPERVQQRVYSIKIATVLAQRSDVPVEQLLRFCEQIHFANLSVSSVEYSALPVLIAFLQNSTNLNREQVIKIVGLLRTCSADSAEGWLHFTQTLSFLFQHYELSFRELESLTLYTAYPLGGSDLLVRVIQYLMELAYNQTYTLQRRICILQVLLVNHEVSYQQKMEATRIVNALLPLEEEAAQFFRNYWRIPIKTDEADIGYIVDLINKEKLPDMVRNQLYQQLRQLIAQYRVTSSSIE